MAPDTSPPPDERVIDCVLALQDEDDWPQVADGYRVTGRWERARSGSVFYRLVGSPAGPELVVKVGPGWAAGTAETVYRATLELHDILSAAGLAIGRGVRPLAWAADPETIVMPYVEGVDVVTVLRTPDHPAWADDARPLKSWMREAGEMLAAFHASQAVDPPELAGATDEATEIAARMRLGGDIGVALVADGDVVRRGGRVYGDFGPGNLHATPDGLLYLLDPPDDQNAGLVHRDLAHFTFEMRRQLAGHGFTRTPPVKGRFGELRRAFLDGYSRSAPGGPLGPGDEAMIALFELRRAAGMARKRFPRRPGDLWWFARLAFLLRGALKRGGPYPE